MYPYHEECDFNTEALSQEELEDLLHDNESLEDLCIVHQSFRVGSNDWCLWATQVHDIDYSIPLTQDELSDLTDSVGDEALLEEAGQALYDRRVRLGIDPTDPTTYPNYPDERAMVERPEPEEVWSL